MSPSQGETSSAANEPPFDPHGCRFDTSTYAGRVAHFYEMVSPLTLFTTADELEAALQLLKRHELGEAAGVADSKLWDAKRIKEACIHPGTGEPMFLLGRMAAFVPLNTAVTAAMILARSPFWIGASQWANQTVNTMVNYVNRSGASCDSSQLAQAYFLACSVACGIGVGAARLVERGPPWIKRLGILVPYTAVVAAGAANLALTRLPEIRSGAPVFSLEGDALGSSSRAAVQSTKQVLMSRIMLLPVMPMLAPPIAMGMLRKAIPLLGRSRAAAVSAEVGLIASTIYCCLPAAIAVFPQTLTLPVTSLEPQFQGRMTSSGKPIEYVTCNKGL